MRRADAIQYTDEQLKGEMAMIMNCDVFLGEGFGALTRHHFRVGAKPLNSSSEPEAATSGDQQKATTGSADEEPVQQQQQHGFKVYALSRYELTSPFCVEKKNEHCLARADISSLDAFLFLSPLPFNFSANVAELAIKQNTWGAENALVEAMREKGAVLKNPCHLLQLGHMHCDGKFRPNVRQTPSSTHTHTHTHTTHRTRRICSKERIRARPRSRCRTSSGEWVEPTSCSRRGHSSSCGVAPRDTSLSMMATTAAKKKKLKKSVTCR